MELVSDKSWNGTEDGKIDVLQRAGRRKSDNILLTQASQETPLTHYLCISQQRSKM